jgi:two-component system sensor kinase FixL
MMNKSLDKDMASRPVARVCAVGCGVLGLWGLLCWGLDQPLLSSVFAQYIPMSPRGALGFSLIGSALFLHARLPRGVGRGLYMSAAALVVALAGGLSLGESLVRFGAYSPANLFHVPAQYSDYLVSRMSRFSSSSLLLAGGGMLLLVRFSRTRWEGLAAATGAAISAANGIVLLGYFYKTPLLYDGAIRPVPLLGAAAACFLGVGLVAATSRDCFPVSIFTGPSIRARLLRIFLPVTFFVVLLDELLGDVFRWYGRMNPALQDALQTLVSGFVVTSAVAYLAAKLGHALDAAEAERNKSEAALRLARAELELRVQERTASLAAANAELIQAQSQIAMLAHAVESTAEPIGITDLQNRFIFVNHAFQETYGYAESEILGKTREIFLAPANPPTLQAEIQAQTRLGGWRGEVLDRRKDGTEFPVFLSTSQIKDPGGRLIGLMGVAQDITERKRSEQVLRESERKLRLIAEHTSDVILAFDMERRSWFINSAVEELTGYTPAEIQQRGFINWIHPDDQERMLQHWEALFVGRGYSEVEFRLVTKTGQVKWCSSTWGPLFDEAGRQIGVHGLERDISERRRLESELLEISAKERRRLGHDIHDGLGQYLTGIALKAKVLEEILAADESAHVRRVKELVGLINTAIRQTRNLAHGLGPVHVEADGFVAALGNLVVQTREIFQMDCTFTCLQDRLAVNNETSLALYRITQEAIHNAITHGQARRIEIRLALQDAHLRLSVQDNGKGFSPASQPHSGMGLHIMRYRASSIGGSLTIDSAPHDGTRVLCSVPQELCLLKGQAAAKQ